MKRLTADFPIALGEMVAIGQVGETRSVGRAVSIWIRRVMVAGSSKA